MKIVFKFAIFIICLSLTVEAAAQKNFTLASPNGKVNTEISVGRAVTYNVNLSGDQMLAPSQISMTLGNGYKFGVDTRLVGSQTRSVEQTIDSRIYKKNVVENKYNELILKFRDYNITFRAYDDGVAYRFSTSLKKSFTVEQEQAEFNFPSDTKTYIPYVAKEAPASFEEQFRNSFENHYTYENLSQWDDKRLAFLPLAAEGANGKKICITEADLLNYPGMYLHNGDKSHSLKAVFAPYPENIKQGGYNNFQKIVESRKDYIAKFSGATDFPWRIVIVTENDIQLADNDMVYRLASPSKGDFSWVKPGKVAWDWWNDWNLFGVDFKTGVNNETYKYYIDFASQNGIEYVILDEGWAVNLKADLMQIVPEIDMEALIRYADSKNVGLILWAGYWAFEQDMETVCRHYSQMGIKGFKVDFMDCDDQPMVDFHRRGAEIAAKYKLLIDYHGTYKPTGLQRTYPNVVNYEGVYGLEQMKWAPVGQDQVTYDVTIPFIRQVAGPMDYTQGAMRNATQKNHRPVWNEAMSQGTRCRQLAQYVIFESPLNMLCDSPSNYQNEKECLDFITTIPTVWDQTKALNGEIAKYVSIARRSGDTWYIGSMTNWDKRELEVDLSFIGDGDYIAELFVDGINSDKVARDYRKEIVEISADRKLKVNMASGGGFAAKIVKRK